VIISHSTGWSGSGPQQRAMALLEAGRPGEAESLCRDALIAKPSDPELLYTLGLALRLLGRSLDAVEPLTEAARRLPRRADVRLALGNTLLDAGRFDDARQCLEVAARLAPTSWQVMYLLGVATSAAGDLGSAIVAFRKAIRGNAGLRDARLRVIQALRECGRMEEAIAAARDALLVEPSDGAIRHDLAMMLALAGRPSEALSEIRIVLDANPAFVEAINTFGNVLKDTGKSREAAIQYRRALAIVPSYADANYNLANVDRESEKYQVAIRRYLRTLAITPGFADAHNNLASALLGAGCIDQALDRFERYLVLRPGAADAEWNRALTLLLKGDLVSGWEGYEARWRLPNFPSPKRQFPTPAWEGEEFRGRTVLLYAEQGAGDAIQFARYVPMAAELGGRVVLECSPALVRLFETLAGTPTVVRAGEPLPMFDAQAPLASLPRIFGTDLASIPRTTPYLKAPPRLRDSWRKRLDRPGLKVGLVWQGNPSQATEPYRSIPLRIFEPIFRVPGCRFFGLQRDFGREQMADLPPGTLEDLGPSLEDFAETAAAVANLDLVISSCTSVAHLAGAIGVPVWVLLRAVPDWRWLLDRDDSPWYPTARLFRQPQPGDWPGVLDRVAVELDRLCRARIAR
jgi:tetratricopeptide (TPR) repeat protein